jgi:hypothetical protein
MKLFLILQTQDDYIQGINKYTLPFEVVKDETKLEGKIQADLKRVKVFVSLDCQHILISIIYSI